jgi:predicted NBD/HSP70 family sugar kinase
MPTAADAAVFECELCRRVQALIASRPEVSFEGIGVTLPGCVDLARRQLAYSANLGWREVDLKTPLERATGLPVEVENAANACALAESWFGTAAPGARDLAVVTVSEGIGTGILADGRLLRGAFGHAGEFGHITVESDGPLCSCGNRGCWELYASNSAAIRHYSGGATPAPSFEDILALAEQGDRRAGEALDRMAHYLGVGMASLVTALGPAVVMVVGEVSRAWKRVGPVVERVAAERALMGQAPRILALDESRQPRLRGTVALLMQKHFALPSGYIGRKEDA